MPPSYPASYDFNNGEQVILEAVPAEGYHFTGWSGSLSGGTNPITLTMDCVKEVVANFNQRPEYRLSLQVNGEGTTTPQAGYHRYVEGSRVTITAAPANGWRFDGWTGSVADAKALSNTVTVSADVIYTVNFSRVLHLGWFFGGAGGGIVIIAMGIWISVRKRLSLI